MRSTALALCLWTAGCSSARAGAVSANSHPPTARVPARALPFREGGLDAAIADARRDHRLVFVDLWAAWCPPCMAMNAWSFGDPAVLALADDFEWVALDHDGAEGERLSAQLGLSSLPTLLVFDPETSAPRAAWRSTPLAGPEVAAFLRTILNSPLPEGAADVFSLTSLLRAESGAGRAARVRADGLLERLPASSPLAPFVVEELVAEANARRDFERCVRLAEAWDARLPPGGLALDTAITAHACAEQATPPHPESARRQLDLAQRIVGSPESSVLPWRRGYSALVVRALRMEQGDAADADEVARLWFEFFREESARGGVAQRASLSAPLELWLDKLGDFAGAANALADVVRASPGDVDALVRWADALKAAGRADEAIAALAHGVLAIAAEGRLPALCKEAELLRVKNDTAAEASVLDVALSLPRAAFVPARLESLRAKAAERRAELRALERDGG